MVPSTVHCQVIINNDPEWWSDTCTLQKGLYSDRWGFSCLCNNETQSCKNCLKQSLSKVISHFRNAGINKGACSVCGDWWTEMSNKSCFFQKVKLTQKSKRKVGNGNEWNIKIHKTPDERPANEEDMLNLCRISLQYLNEALKYAQYQFKKRGGTTMKCSSFRKYFKECEFQCHRGFSTGAKKNLDQMFGYSMSLFA